MTSLPSSPERSCDVGPGLVACAWRSRTDAWRAAFCGLALLLPLACGKPEEAPPSAGQTGSPVAPDYGGHVPFRPPVERPPNGGSAPPVPRLPLPEPRRTASFGAWLYVAAPRGLFAVDTGSAPAAVVRLLPELSVQWIAVDGTALDVIAQVLPDDPWEVEHGTLTRLYRFDLSGNPAAPALLASIDLPGRLTRARVDGGRVVVLTGEYRALACTSRLGYFESGYAPERQKLSDLRWTGAAWSMAQQISVEAEGFIEAASAFVLIQGGYSGIPAVLSVVAIEPDGLDAWPRIDVGGEPVPGIAMAVSGNRIASLENSASGVALRVFDRGGTSAPSLPTLPSIALRTSDGVPGAQFAGPFLLVPSTQLYEPPGPGQPGVIVDWQRAGGPVVTGELPADLSQLQVVGDRWLAWSSERSVLFRVGAAGTFDVEAELAAPPGRSANIRAHWDAIDQRVWWPHLIGSSGIGSEPAAYGLAVLDLSSATPEWQPGPRVQGVPGISAFEAMFTGSTELLLQRTSSGLFATTDTDMTLQHWLVEAIDPGSEQSSVIALAERTLDAALLGDQLAELRADYRGTRSVRLSTEAAAGGASAASIRLPLEYGAERLQALGDGWLSSSLRYSNGCWPDAVGQEDVPCLPEGTPAVSWITSGPAQLLRDVPLPSLATDARTATGSVTREWIEVVAQNGQVALLEHRGVVCRSESACAALGLEYEVEAQSGGCPRADGQCSPDEILPNRRVMGDRNERWLHPFDPATSSFADPIHLGDSDGYGWLSAEGLQVEGGAALAQLIPLQIAPDGTTVQRARIELLVMPSLDAAGARALSRVTVPGFPLYASPRLAITLEPQGALGQNGAAPGVFAHRLSIDSGLAYIEQTLSLPSGLAGYRWANDRGYALFVGDDRCAQPSVTLVSLRLNAGVLEEAGSIDVPGTGWQLDRASDQIALLSRGVGPLVQHAVIDADGGTLRLRALDTRSGLTPVGVFGREVRYAAEP